MTKTFRLDLPLVLPDIADERDRCIDRLVADIKARDGVQEVHVVPPSNGDPAELCVHYDPDTLELARIRQIVEHDGARVTDRFGHLLWEIEGIDHSRRARNVSEHIERIEGVVEANASASGLLRVEFDRRRVNEARIEDELNRLGGRIHTTASAEEQAERPDHAHEGHDHSHGGLFAIFGERSELIFAVLAGVAVLAGWLLETFTRVPGAVPLGFFVAGYVLGGAPTLREAYDSIRAGRFEIDFLMLVAAAGAAALGKFFEGALLLFLFSLGHALEHYAMGRAKRAIEALGELAPKTALVRRSGGQEEVPVEALEVGDTVIVRPNVRIPADGFVVTGQSPVDQAPITGESVPVDKYPVADAAAAGAAPERVDKASRVFAGTINGGGALEIQVTKSAQDNTLARVVQMVSEAETQKSPTQRFTDRFERVFVPAVIALAVLLLFAPLVTGESFADAFYRSMAVLVAASPCALAIATPSAVLSSVARAGRGGVLVKGGAPLESLGVLRAIAFDKTGTVTEGRPKLTDVVACDGADERALLRTAVAVERLSDHPLAAAIVRDSAGRIDGEIPEAEALESITGRGVRARIDGVEVYIGKDDLFAEIAGPAPTDEVLEAVRRLEQNGRTTMIVRHGDTYLGVLGLMDTPRAAAQAVIARLRQVGIRRMIMISGDNQRVADAVAKAVGLDEAWGDLMPADKVSAIQTLRQQGKVAMVGDGVNDAPAMANATVGIAMGAAGSDVALETADVALMADDLRRLPFAVGLSRSTSRIIKQNLYTSLGIVAILVPATLLGLGIGPAVAVHEGSTLLVVINALRLLAYKDRDRQLTGDATTEGSVASLPSPPDLKRDEDDDDGQRDEGRQETDERTAHTGACPS